MNPGGGFFTVSSGVISQVLDGDQMIDISPSCYNTTKSKPADGKNYGAPYSLIVLMPPFPKSVSNAVRIQRIKRIDSDLVSDQVSVGDFFINARFIKEVVQFEDKLTDGIALSKGDGIVMANLGITFTYSLSRWGGGAAGGTKEKDETFLVASAAKIAGKTEQSTNSAKMHSAAVVLSKQSLRLHLPQLFFFSNITILLVV